MACLRARVGDAEAALRNLDIFVRAFILRNGFHANGDQTKSGFSSFTYRPFTLEGNFLAMEAVHEMLLQSWSPDAGQREARQSSASSPPCPGAGTTRRFDDLRAEGGHRVSAGARTTPRPGSASSPAGTAWCGSATTSAGARRTGTAAG